MFRTLLIFVLSWSFSAYADPAENCRALLRHAVVEKRALTADDLRALADAPAGTNPADFGTWKSETEKQVFRRAFSDALVAEAIREEAHLLAAQVDGENAQRTEAVSETRAVMFPKFIAMIPYPDLGSPRPITVDGQSRIAVGAPEEKKLAIIDPVTMARVDHQTRGSVYDRPVLIEDFSTPWLAYVGREGMGRGKLAGMFLDGGAVWLRGNGGYTDPQSIAVNGEIYLVAANNIERALTLFSNSQPVDDIHFAVGNVPDRSPGPHVAIWRGKGDPLIAVAQSSTRPHLILINPVTNEVLTPPYPGVPIRNAQFFAGSRGKPRLLLQASQAIYTAPVNGGRLKKILDRSVTRLEQISARNGAPRALVVMHNGKKSSLGVLKLRDGGVDEVASIVHPQSNLARFTFKGREYATWGTDNGEVSVTELSAPGAIVRNKVLNYRIQEIVPFESADGGVWAVLKHGVGASPLSLVQLIGPL